MGKLAAPETESYRVCSLSPGLALELVNGEAVWHAEKNVGSGIR